MISGFHRSFFRTVANQHGACLSAFSFRFRSSRSAHSGTSRNTLQNSPANYLKSIALGSPELSRRYANGRFMMRWTT